MIGETRAYIMSSWMLQHPENGRGKRLLEAGDETQMIGNEVHHVKLQELGWKNAVFWFMLYK